MYCNFTTECNAVSHQIHNTCIVIPTNYFIITVISIYNPSTVIEPTGRRTRRALEKGEKYCPLSKNEVKTKL